MKKNILVLALLAAALPFTCAVAKDAAQPAASAEEVKSLRKNPIAGAEDAPVDGTWKPKDTKVARTFIHQPPVIPHDITGFVISSSQNDCLNCHGVEGSGAPKPFKTHYSNRDGKVTETIAARWNNCTQCHAGQAEVEPLVENVFNGVKAEKK